MEGEFSISPYVEGVQAAIEAANKNELAQGVIKGMEAVSEGIKELEPLVQTPRNQKRFKADLEGIIDELKEICIKGEGSLALGKMRTLRDRVNTLKAVFSREKG